MRKIIVLTMLLCLVFSSISFAGVKTVSEPERNNAYSLTTQLSTSTFFGGTKLQYSFTKYATPTTSEFWIRLNKAGYKDKLLPYAILYIDGTAYPIVAIENPGEKYTEAGLSVFDFASGNAIYNQGITKYFLLSRNIIDHLKYATHVTLIYHSTNIINRHVDIDEDFIEEIKKIIATPYEQIELQWQPKNDAR